MQWNSLPRKRLLIENFNYLKPHLRPTSLVNIFIIPFCYWNFIHSLLTFQNCYFYLPNYSLYMLILHSSKKKNCLQFYRFLLFYACNNC